MIIESYERILYLDTADGDLSEIGVLLFFVEETFVGLFRAVFWHPCLEEKPCSRL